MENLLNIVKILDLNIMEKDKLNSVEIGTKLVFYRRISKENFLEIAILKVNNNLYDYVLTKE